MIEPALTADRWALLDEDPHCNIDIRVAWACDEACLRDAGPRDERHALAALCLHGQPFGFTWDDVDRLLVAADRDEETVSYMGGGSYRSKFRSIAERIAALLPPREGPDVFRKEPRDAKVVMEFGELTIAPPREETP